MLLEVSRMGWLVDVEEDMVEKFNEGQQKLGRSQWEAVGVGTGADLL
jgi:hypothetical protein